MPADALFSAPTRRYLVFLWTGLCMACQPGEPDRYSEELAPGVHYHRIHLIEGPWWVHVVEVDLPRAWSSGVRLRTARAMEGVGVEKTSVLATAAKALVGINGDFFYTSESSRTAGLQIREGALIQVPQRRSAFAITEDGQPLIAVFQMELGLITAAGENLPVAAFNRPPAAGELSFYNHYAQARHDSVRAALGFQLQSLGRTSIANDTVPTRVLQIRRQAWPLLLDRGQWLIAAGEGHPGAEAIAPGDTVRLFCRLQPARARLQEAIGGGPRILRDGEVSVEYEQERLSRTFAQERHPRTAIGYTRDEKKLFLVTVDGRQPGYSVGMSLAELAEFMRVRLGAFQALNLDGGGSTTMVVRQQVVNNPSDQTGERPVANALLVVATGQNRPSSL